MYDNAHCAYKAHEHFQCYKTDQCHHIRGTTESGHLLSASLCGVFGTYHRRANAYSLKGEYMNLINAGCTGTKKEFELALHVEGAIELWYHMSSAAFTL